MGEEDADYFEQMEAHLRFDLDMEVLDLETCFVPQLDAANVPVEAAAASAPQPPAPPPLPLALGPVLSLRQELAKARRVISGSKNKSKSKSAPSSSWQVRRKNRASLFQKRHGVSSSDGHRRRSRRLVAKESDMDQCRGVEGEEEVPERKKIDDGDQELEDKNAEAGEAIAKSEHKEKEENGEAMVGELADTNGNAGKAVAEPERKEEEENGDRELADTNGNAGEAVAEPERKEKEENGDDELKEEGGNDDAVAVEKGDESDDSVVDIMNDDDEGRGGGTETSKELVTNCTRDRAAEKKVVARGGEDAEVAEAEEKKTPRGDQSFATDARRAGNDAAQASKEAVATTTRRQTRRSRGGGGDAPVKKTKRQRVSARAMDRGSDDGIGGSKEELQDDLQAEDAAERRLTLVGEEQERKDANAGDDLLDNRSVEPEEEMVVVLECEEKLPEELPAEGRDGDNVSPVLAIGEGSEVDEHQTVERTSTKRKATGAGKRRNPSRQKQRTSPRNHGDDKSEGDGAEVGARVEGTPKLRKGRGRGTAARQASEAADKEKKKKMRRSEEMVPSVGKPKPEIRRVRTRSATKLPTSVTGSTRKEPVAVIVIDEDDDGDGDGDGEAGKQRPCRRSTRSSGQPVMEDASSTPAPVGKHQPRAAVTDMVDKVIRGSRIKRKRGVPVSDSVFENLL